MLPAFLLALREGLEAALIVGIVLGALRKLGHNRQQGSVWQGVVAAVAVSLVAALLLYAVGLKMEGAAEQIFEGVTMLLAAAILTWMIFWMQTQGRRINRELETGVRQAVSGMGGNKGHWALFSVAFIAVLREGIETALFLTATTFTAGGQATLLGALLGLSAAAALGYILFATTRQLNVKRFFQVTSVLLILFAAGLVAHSIHEFNEVGWIPAVVEHLWDTNGLLDENSGLGLILKALFGYNGNPSLTEVLGYVVYWAALIFGVRRLPQALTAPGAGQAIR
ncbi:FTR1 family protein [Candidatus Amarolinea dominans]|uniref:FTR1 family iron permease n=1 Tax=Candidatus Amarolinea dominans TaxID=3140696 RepID=UPI001D6CB501|nr:FTR1 family protein [Anaerolineae bacterium]